MPRRIIARHGLSGALLYRLRSASWRTGGRIKVLKYLIVDQPVPPPPRRAASGGARIQVREVGRDEYRPEWFPRPAHVIASRFDQGSVCLVAFRDQQPVGCLWLVAKRYLEDEVYCVFEPCPGDRALWDYDVYVHPEHRIGRAFGRLWQAAWDWMRARGFTSSLSRIHAFNEASLNAHLRAGAEPVASIVFLSVGRLQISLSTVSPRLAVCFGISGMPHFRLHARAVPMS